MCHFSSRSMERLGKSDKPTIVVWTLIYDWIQSVSVTATNGITAYSDKNLLLSAISNNMTGFVLHWTPDIDILFCQALVLSPPCDFTKQNMADNWFFINREISVRSAIGGSQSVALSNGYDYDEWENSILLLVVKKCRSLNSSCT